MSMAEMRKNSSPLILMEGTLEKLKEREFPWIFSGKKFSTTWVLRYYVLRHADISDNEAFLLEQHENCTPFSKVHKSLDLRCVLQDKKLNCVLLIAFGPIIDKYGMKRVIYLLQKELYIDTNISLKVGNQNWVLAIHYKARHSGRLKVLYLAAHSETEMNMWIMKLSYACKLQKQDVGERQLVPDCMNNHCFTDSSAVESPIMSNVITNNTNCIDSVTTHAYIRLKDCSSTPSLDEPPKPSHSSRMLKGGKQVFESGRCVLDQPLTPADGHEILSIKEEEWSNETVRPSTVGSIDAEETFLSFDSSLISSVSNSTAPKPLPRRHNFHNVPPEVDRSCKPIGIRYIAVNTNQERSGTDNWKKEIFAASSRLLPTISSHQQSLHAVVLRNKQIPIGQEALYDNESMRRRNGALDYLDPMREPLAQSQSFIKSSQRPKISCATEYTQIDEESTKAVLKANVRQDEMRRNGFSV